LLDPLRTLKKNIPLDAPTASKDGVILFCPMKKPIGVLISALLFVFWGSAVAAQQRDSDGLPDAPQPKEEAPVDQNQSDQNQQKGANPLTAPIGLIAKRSYVFPEIAYTSGSLTAKEKFELFLSQSASPAQIFASVAGAAIGQARDSLPGYGQGWSGYGDRFGSSLASGASTHLFSTYLLSSMLHEDPRYFVKLQGTWKSRVGHALARVVTIRTDEGGYKFNIPQTLGPLMAEGLANVYLPQGERTAGKTFERWGVRMSWGAASNLVKEYWPTIFKDLGISKVAPGLKPAPPPTPPGPQLQNQ
jgi:hypothetical protein